MGQEEREKVGKGGKTKKGKGDKVEMELQVFSKCLLQSSFGGIQEKIMRAE